MIGRLYVLWYNPASLLGEFWVAMVKRNQVGEHYPVRQVYESCMPDHYGNTYWVDPADYQRQFAMDPEEWL